MSEMSECDALTWQPPFPAAALVTMLAPERHRVILSLLADLGRLETNDLQSRLQVSPATLRRDIASLANRGLLKRTHGGVLPCEFSLREPPYEQKAARAANAKARLGHRAVALMPMHGVVFVDGGTTCLEVGRALLDRPKLQVFTNSVPLLALAGQARATLVGIGGTVRPLSLSLTGALAQSWLEHLNFDVAVVGCSGIQPDRGPATADLSDAALKAEVLRRARQRILVAHAGKWGQPATLVYAPWKAFTHVVTDHVLTHDQKSHLAAAGVGINR
jgi:DeoR family fructose operon transcriptional repressor